MYSNETLQKLQDAIVNGEEVKAWCRDKIIDNITATMCSLIKGNNPNATIVANVEYSTDNFSVTFMEAKAFRKKQENPLFKSSKIEIPYDEIANAKEIIADTLKKETEFDGDHFIHNAQHTVPYGVGIDPYVEPIAESDKTCANNFLGWEEVDWDYKNYVEFLMNNYIEVYNLMNDETFSVDDKAALLIKLDLADNRFKNEIKEVLDERFPDMQKEHTIPQTSEIIK